ncbi:MULTISPECIES: DUF503 domain-containing protein [Clostridium]|uniref:DUF503 domain-containing protein n=3 Tax=Clostridium TaxID=1485 RepID=A0A6V8SQK8_9CLOT|nr:MULTISPECIES: DUF503 domain-containing protein [Clostridium]GFP77488.1 hypothetical protein bsdtw1_03616 [Clostridium fungisolvens]GFZ31356.1 hypothetical protein CSC2_18820 [Clostridium zeae]GKU23213.1 hypothetical protein CFOLD11_00390 [Clostridium folliculivorans]GKU29259.1 hypothetical protein CFB3_13650 [Clostridium folliculivorans]
MIIGTAEVTIRIPWAKSLKEKRMVAKSLIQRVKNKFNVSISEVEHQDNHKLLVLGIATVSNSSSHANNSLNEVVDFIYDNTEAEVEDINIEIL